MITSGQQTIGTAAVQVDGNAWNYFTLHLSNDDNSDAIWIGNHDLTINSGLRLDKLENIELRLTPSDVLYIVSTKEGHKISWLRVMDI